MKQLTEVETFLSNELTEQTEKYSDNINGSATLNSIHGQNGHLNLLFYLINLNTFVYINLYRWCEIYS